MREFEYSWDDFEALRRISTAYSGIVVPDDKFDMFYGRLSKRLRALGLTRFKDYCRYLETFENPEFNQFINAITTNLTAFFRENHHFEVLETKILPEILNRNQSTREIKVWSAGCSTGEEPYSIAMTLLENMPSQWSAKILATDLDTEVLQTAANGIYRADRVVGISEPRLKKWFKKGTGAQSGRVKVDSKLQKIVHFRQMNLMQAWPIKNHFDLIFCRNVFIYFDLSTKKSLASRFSRLLDDGSYLFLGHSESLHQVSEEFKSIGQTVYRKVKSA